MCVCGFAAWDWERPQRRLWRLIGTIEGWWWCTHALGCSLFWTLQFRALETSQLNFTPPVLLWIFLTGVRSTQTRRTRRERRQAPPKKLSLCVCV